MKKNGSTLLIIVMVVLLVVVGGILAYIIIKPDKHNFVCGDKICQSGENSKNCLKDCPLKTYCGDNICDAKEVANPSLCPEDCDDEPITSSCGDGNCNGDESCGTTDTAPECNSDCGSCPQLTSDYEMGLSNWGGWSPDQDYFDYLDGLEITWSRANFLDFTSRIVKDVDEERAFCKNYCNEPLEKSINCEDLQLKQNYICGLLVPRRDLFENQYSDMRLTISKGFNLIGQLDLINYRSEESFREYVRETVDYFGDEIKYWEIGNEVSIPEFWSGTPQKYGELVEIASNEINKVCSDCKVGISFAGLMIAKPDNVEEWLNVIENSCDYFDFIDAHVLLAMREADLIDMRTDFTALGHVCPGKEFISTETSLQDNMGSLGGSREEQARGLIKMYSILFDMGYKKIFYRSMFDDPLYQGPDAGWAHDGLITKHPEHELKPAFYAFKTLTEKIGGFSSVEKITDTQYKFTVNNKDVYILWCDSGTCTIDSEITGNVKVTDYLGNEETIDADEIVLTESPVFVEELT